MIEIENCTLYQGDCIEVMDNLIRQGVKVDAIITDIPYGTTKCSWDSIIPFDKMWECIKNIRKENTPIVLFGCEPFSSYLRLSNIKEYKYDIYWQKEKPINYLHLKKRIGKTIENISVFYKKQCVYNPQMKIYLGKRQQSKPRKGPHKNILTGNVKMKTCYKDNGYRFPCDLQFFNKVKNGKYVHPTQKPVALMEFLIKTYTNENDIVLDFTMGSGSTGVACVNTNRKFIGIELDKGYFDIAVNRIKDSTRQLKLF